MFVSISNMPNCTHVYLTSCKTNPQPPGLGDFLRGTIALFYLTESTGYTLSIDYNSHPIFSFLKFGNHYTVNNQDTEIHECIYPISYPDIIDNLCALFQRNTSFSVLTNSFYATDSSGNFLMYAKLSENSKKFMRKLLTPSDMIECVLSNVYADLGVNLVKGYKVIHLRLGDIFIHNDVYDENVATKISDKFKHIIMSRNITDTCVLLTDSASIGRKISKLCPQIVYWDNNKIHTGDLKNKAIHGLRDTVIDMVIMSRANEILTFTSSSVPSSFCTIPAVTFDVPIVELFLEPIVFGTNI